MTEHWIGPSPECWASEMLYETSADSLFTCTGTCTTLCSWPHCLHTHMCIAIAHRFSSKRETACSLIKFKDFQNQNVDLSILKKLERFLYGLEKWFWLVIVICFISQWMKRSKHGFFIFPPMQTLIWKRHCSIIGQWCCSMTSKQSIG